MFPSAKELREMNESITNRLDLLIKMNMSQMLLQSATFVGDDINSLAATQRDCAMAFMELIESCEKDCQRLGIK